MTARPIRRNAQTPDRNGKIFYTSTTSLSHISKISGYQAAHAWRRCGADRHDPNPPALWFVRLIHGKRVLVASDTTKTKSSMRTLPLVSFMRERLLALKEEQQENRRLCGRSYIKEYLEYVCVNEIGDLIKPHYVTESFSKLLKAKKMRQIRYHDLRHSCASLLLANGVPMKQIQEWLGHSNFSTTANIYAHLDYSLKPTSADAMLNGLGFAQN